MAATCFVSGVISTVVLSTHRELSRDDLMVAFSPRYGQGVLKRTHSLITVFRVDFHP
jgi:hypothetical protein